MNSISKVLIVEDEHVVALDLSATVASFGFCICGTAATAADAIALAESERPALVLMDIVLAGEVDGIQAATYLRESLNIPVIFLTAHADHATVARATKAGPFGFLVKPVTPDDLRTTIEVALYRARLEQERTTPVHPSRSTHTLTGREESVLLFLRQLQVFAKLDDAALAGLAAEARLEDVRAGELLVFEGTRQSSGFVVQSGRIAMLKAAANGKELIVELLPPGDPLGLIAVLDGDPYPLTARAQVDSEIVWLSRAAVLDTMKHHPEVMTSLVKEVCTRLRSAHDTSRALAFDRVEARVAQVLCALIPRFAEAAEKADFRIEVSRQELANLTAATPETISRVTRALEREGVLRISGQGEIEIPDIGRLRQIADDNCDLS
ncbi:MAG: response regulator [Bdellovibrionales bacterium]|nr:response regulator [Bdellovibrionales bacterium]